MASERLDIVVTERGAKTVSRDIRRVGKAGKSASSGVDLLKKALFLIGGAAVIKRIVGLADSFALLQNQIRVVSGGMGDLTANTKRLFDISNRTRTSIAQNVQLFQRLSFASKELGFSQKDLFTFVEQTGKLLAIQGGSAAAARGALVQLTQAMGSGIVRGEEFNSILEGAFTVALAAAKGIDRAGGSVSKLRSLIIKGLVTSKEFARAILSQADATDKAFAKTKSTIGQAFNVLNNELTQFFGQLGKDSGLLERFVAIVQLASSNLDVLAIGLGAVAAVMLGSLAAVAIPAVIAGLTAIATVALPILVAAMIPVFAFIVTTAVLTSKDVSEIFRDMGDQFGGIFKNLISQFTGGSSAINTFQSRILDFSITLSALGGASGVAKEKIAGLLKTLDALRDDINQAALIQKLIDPASNSVRELGSQLIVVDALIKKIEARTFRTDKPTPTAGKVKKKVAGFSKSDISSFKSLRDQLDPLGASFRSTAADQALLTKAMEAGNITVGQYGQLMDSLAQRSLKEVNTAMKELNPAFARQQALLLEMQKPAKDYAETIADLNALLDAGSISQEVFNQKMRDARIVILETQTSAAAGAERAFLKMQRSGEDAAAITEKFFVSSFQKAEDAIVKFADTGKFEFKELAKSILLDLVRIAAQRIITSIAGSGGGGGGGGFGGGASGSIGGFIGNLFADKIQGQKTQGFFSGGSFTVGARTAVGGAIPGVDNRLIAFRARDGENVEITPRGQSPGGGRPLTVHFNFPKGTDAGSFQRSQGQIAARTQALLMRADQRNN